MIARIALVWLLLTAQAVAQTQIRSRDDLKDFGLCARIRLPDGRVFTYTGMNQTGLVEISDHKGQATILHFDKLIGATISKPEGGLCISE